MDFSHYPHRKQERKTREMIMSALGQKSPLSCLWHFCYVCWFLFPGLGSAFVLCLCVCVISTAVWRFASDHPSFCSFAFSFEIMRLSLWLLGQVTSLLDFGEMPWKTQVHVLCFGLEMLIEPGSVLCKCVAYLIRQRFSKVLRTADHFIGGRRTRGPPSKNSPLPKLHASEQKKHYTGSQSYHSHIFSLH
jgi:hypothetical protein